jgi:hypothetical protein
VRVELQKFDGGRTVMMVAGGIGVVGLGLTGVGALNDPRPALFSYLFAFAYWGGLALASVVLLQIFHATRARWMAVLRRAVETMALTIVLFLVLAIPILAGMKHIYSWVEPAANLSREAAHLLHHKAPYLNVKFFIARTVVYLLLATLVSQRLFGWSTKQDASGDIALTVKQRRFGTGMLPLVALTFSFAAFDWLMSLDPLWFSTIFGVYYFAGSFLGCISLLVVVTDRARGKNLYGDLVTAEHIHNLGKLMLAFTCFWGYIGFSQLLLIWIAGLPEETPFYIIRFKSQWALVGIFLILGHFVVPFGALLSRSLKRNRSRLAAVAFWILLMHSVDLYWLVMPNLDTEGVVFPWTLPFAFIGVGGLTVAFAVSRLRGHYTVPVRDPYIGESIAYRQP